MSAAISMTLCEVATGIHYSIPSECMAYFNEDEDIHQEIDHRTRGGCVEYAPFASHLLGDKTHANVAPWQAAPSSGQVTLAISEKYVGCLRLRNSDAYIHQCKPHTAQLCYAFRRWNDIGKL